MHLGFASLEVGLTQAKNSVNIFFKNTLLLAIGILTFTLCGFNLMYPGFEEGSLGLFKFAGFGLQAPEGAAGLIEYSNGNYTYWTDFLFQAMFAATCVTIVSGAVAERIKLMSFFVFALIYVGVIYPIAGSWHWGGGWLSQLGFYDFAGSTIVHSVGGWAAIVGALIIGPRLGKYVGSTIRPISGHNLPLAGIGVFLLWFGWFGFNGGSVLSADAGTVSYVLVTTSLGAAAGIVTAMITSWTAQNSPDLTMVLNGALAGLVSVTAGADVLSINGALIAGAVGGIIVVLSVLFLDKFKIDDPVGAISVHLVCGIWGTLVVGLLSPKHNFLTQLIGVLGIGLFCIVTSGILFVLLKYTIGIRVDEDEEKKGLDISEHQQDGYSGFQIFTTK